MIALAKDISTIPIEEQRSKTALMTDEILLRENKTVIPLHSDLSKKGTNFLPSETYGATTTNISLDTHAINTNPKTISLRPKVKPSTLTVLREEKLQEWEGRVLDVNQDNETFTAFLTDLTLKENMETEEGEFPLSDLSSSAIDLLDKGAIFRLIVGYKYEGTTRYRFTRFAFRNMPKWSIDEIDKADEEAKRLNAIEWD